jgi:hypothetical protein
MQIFEKSRSLLKIEAPKVWHEASYTLRTHKNQTHDSKFSLQGDLEPAFCLSLVHDMRTNVTFKCFISKFKLCMRMLSLLKFYR